MRYYKLLLNMLVSLLCFLLLIFAFPTPYDIFLLSICAITVSSILQSFLLKSPGVCTVPTHCTVQMFTQPSCQCPNISYLCTSSIS